MSDKQVARFILETGRVMSKKNSKQIFKIGRRTKIVSSDRYLAWESTAKLELLRQKLEQQKEGIEFPLKGSLQVMMIFEMEGRQHEPDLSNLLEGPQDVMQVMGIIENDRQIDYIACQKRMSSTRTRATIVITEL